MQYGRLKGLGIVKNEDDSTIFTGNFVHNRQMGRGQLQHSDNVIETGNWHYGKKHGLFKI